MHVGSSPQSFLKRLYKSVHFVSFGDPVVGAGVGAEVVADVGAHFSVSVSEFVTS